MITTKLAMLYEKTEYVYYAKTDYVDYEKTYCN